MMLEIQEDSPTRGMRSAYLCHRTRISWYPKWADTECGECGHVTGYHDAAEPSFHGERKWDLDTGNIICARCGEILPDIEKINIVALEKLLPKIEEAVLQQSRLLAHLKGSY